MFKKTCKPLLIQKINVVVICEEILSTVQVRDGRNYGRFSLYLSSQLMYGATKILFYQTKFFQEYLFKVNWKLLDINRNNDEFHAITSLDLPEVPPINEVFRNLEISSNLHLITEEPYTSAIEHLMQDEMNFGVLPNHEMEKFILPEAEEISLNEIRRFRWEESIEIPGESVQVPLVDVDEFEIETNIQRESLNVIPDHGVKTPVPATPKKRTLKSPAEIPAKRSRISSAEESIPPPLVQQPPALVSELPQVPEILPDLQQETLPTVEDVELINIKPSRRIKVVDKKTKLTDDQIRRFIGNVTAHTIKHHLFTATLPSAIKYLTQPSTKIFGTSWGETLTIFFSQYLTKPLMVQDEFQDILNFEVEETLVGETIRADNSSKLQDQTGELSSKLAAITNETINPSSTLEKILPAEDIKVKGSEVHKDETKDAEEFVVELPEIETTDLEEKIGKDVTTFEKFDKEVVRTSKSGSSLSSKTCLNKRELLVLMTILWNESRLIKFHDLISPENYNKIDAACAFQYCLEFHAEKVVILKQAEPFDTIWIEKYPYYTAESGEDIAET